MLNRSKTAIIVQARMGSTRFPNKMTVPFFEGSGMLAYLLRRLLNSNISVPVILAIPSSEPNKILKQIAIDHGINYHCGNETDVLQRFIDAAEAYQIERIIRVCADNPFLDTRYLKELIEAFAYSDADYLSYRLDDGTPTIKSHFGFWAEAVTLNTLKKVCSLTDETFFHEHVTNYIYSHPDEFRLEFLKADPEIVQNRWARFTVDTEGDFNRMKALAQKIGYSANAQANDLIKRVAESPPIRKAMETEIRKNQK